MLAWRPWGGGIQVVDTVPHLVEQVLPQVAASLEERIELGRLWISHERRHDIKATARPGLRAPIAHDPMR
jgi:hypothetical protein